MKDGAIMFHRKYCISYCAIMARSIVVLLSGPMNRYAAQNALTPPHPDRIASNYPIRYGPATIESNIAALDHIRTYLKGRPPASTLCSKTEDPVVKYAQPMIYNCIDYISNNPIRLQDGVLGVHL
jgi:hypothetical protein